LAAFGAMKPLVGFLNHAVDQIWWKRLNAQNDR
jgi:hypothetical protein